MKGTLTPTLRRILTARPFWVAVLFVLFFTRAFATLDPDFGWHLASGQYFITHGIPATDIFTYTAQNFPWIDHEWLSDVFVAVVYGSGGYVLLALLFAGLWTLGTWLAARRASILVMVLAGISVLPFSGVRTITWSFVFLTIIVLLLRLPRWYKLLIIPLFILWANLHGSFVFGYFYLAYEAIRRRSWKIGVLLLAAVAVSAINPYGLQIYVEILRTLTDGNLRGRVVEWSAVLFPLAALPYILLFIATFVVVSRTRWRAYLGLDTITFVASLLTVRTTPLFTVLSIESLQARLDELRDRIPQKLDQARLRFLRGVAIGLSIIVAIVVVVTLHTVTHDRESGYPVQAIADLHARPCDGNILNDYNYGGYLIWKYPEQKVYIDGRMPSWQYQGVNYLNDYYRIFDDKPYRDQTFQKYSIRCVLLGPGYSEFLAKLHAEGWTGTSYRNGATLLRSPKSAE